MFINKMTVSGAILILLSMVGSACRKDLNFVPVVDKGSNFRLQSLLSDNINFYRFDSAVRLAGLADTLTGTQSYTVFVVEDNTLVEDSSTVAYLASQTNYGLPIPNSVWASPIQAYLLKGAFRLQDLPFSTNQSFTNLLGGSLWVSKWLQDADTLVTVNGIRVKTADVPASNGYITTLTGILVDSTDQLDLMQALESNYSFTYLVTALVRTHLDSLLHGPGPYTFFAPTNAAFNSYFSNPNNGAPNTIDSILAMDSSVLVDLLKYHILSGRYFLSDFQRLNPGTDTVSLQMMNLGVMDFAINSAQVNTSLQPNELNVLVSPANQSAAYVALPIDFSIYQLHGEPPQFTIPYPTQKDIPVTNGVLHYVNAIVKP